MWVLKGRMNTTLYFYLILISRDLMCTHPLYLSFEFRGEAAEKSSCQVIKSGVKNLSTSHLCHGFHNRNYYRVHL